MDAVSPVSKEGGYGTVPWVPRHLHCSPHVFPMGISHRSKIEPYSAESASNFGTNRLQRGQTLLYSLPRMVLLYCQSLVLHLRCQVVHRGGLGLTWLDR